MLKTKNIIFDLGGVILDLDFKSCLNRFSDLGYQNVRELMNVASGVQFVKDYEKGLCTDDEFLSCMQDAYPLIPNSEQKKPDKESIRKAWNMIIGEMPQGRLDLLAQVSEHYRIFLLSNTCRMHIAYMNDKIKKQLPEGKRFDDFFSKAYYSYEMGLAKPDVRIYEQVLRENQLDPSETLFIDDNADNIAGAKQAGLQVFHLSEQDVRDLFKNGICVLV